MLTTVHSYVGVPSFKCEGKNSSHDLIPNPHIYFPHKPIKMNTYIFLSARTSLSLNYIHEKTERPVELRQWKVRCSEEILNLYVSYSELNYLAHNVVIICDKVTTCLN